jgi:hypothetical protein
LIILEKAALSKTIYITKTNPIIKRLVKVIKKSCIKVGSFVILQNKLIDPKPRFYKLNQKQL